MKVKLLTGMSGSDGSFSPGEIIDLPGEHAERLIADGGAEPVTPVKKRAVKKSEKREKR